jgi:protein-tyrosine phosphatase
MLGGMPLDLEHLEPSRPYSSDEFHHSEALPGRLWLGEAPRGKDLPRLRELGVTDIVNLTSVEDVVAAERDGKFDVHHFPFPDGFFGARGAGPLRAHAVQMMEQACRRLEELLDSNKPTYLHCVAGISRSPTVFMLYLIRSGQVKTFPEAHRRTHAVRSVVSPNPDLVEIVRELEPGAFPSARWW